MPWIEDPLFWRELWQPGNLLIWEVTTSWVWHYFRPCLAGSLNLCESLPAFKGADKVRLLEDLCWSETTRFQILMAFCSHVFSLILGDFERFLSRVISGHLLMTISGREQRSMKALLLDIVEIYRDARGWPTSFEIRKKFFHKSSKGLCFLMGTSKY